LTSWFGDMEDIWPLMSAEYFCNLSNLGGHVLRNVG